MSEKHSEVSFEEALNRTGFGKYNILMFFLCSSLVTTMVFEGMSMSFLVPASACELNTTSVQQGLMAGMPLIGVIATSHVWGYLADRRGRRSVLTISLILGSSLAFVSAFSPNWIIFSVFKLISCSSVSGTYALSITLLSESTPQAKRGSLVILTTGLFMLAHGTMSVLTIPILPLQFSYHIPVLNIEFNSWRLLAIIFSMPCFLGAIGIHCAWESPKYLVSVGRHEEAVAILKRIYCINHGTRNTDEFNVKTINLDEEKTDLKNKSFWSQTVSQTLPILKPPLLKNTIVLSLFFCVIYMSTNPFHTWLPTIADGFIRAIQAGQADSTFCEMLRYSQNITTIVEEPNKCVLNATAMSMVFGFSILAAIVNTSIGLIIPYYGRKKMIATIQIITGMCGVCINFGTYWILNAFLLIVFVSANLNFGVVTTFTVDIYPTYLRAMAVCLTLMVGRISAVVGINIVKDMLTNNCEAAFYTFGSLTLAGSLLVLFLPIKKTSSIQEATQA